MARRSIRGKREPGSGSSREARSFKAAGADLEIVLGLPVTGQQLAVENGLPFATIVRLGELLAMPLEDVAAHVAIPLRTLARRKSTGCFDPLESDRLLRCARVFVRARALFGGDAVAARSWLTSPRRAFASRTPLEFAATEVGAREVESQLGRLEHGVFP